MTDHHYTLPAEWEPQAGVQLTWPHEDTDWQPYLKEITQTFVEIAQAVAQREPLLIAARDTETVRQLLEDRLTEAEMLNVQLAITTTHGHATTPSSHLLRKGHPLASPTSVSMVGAISLLPAKITR